MYNSNDRHHEGSIEETTSIELRIKKLLKAVSRGRAGGADSLSIDRIKDILFSTRQTCSTPYKIFANFFPTKKPKNTPQ